MSTPEPPNGRERLSLALGNKNVALATNNLLSILMLIGGVVGVYLIVNMINDRMARIEGIATQIHQAIQDNRVSNLAVVQRIFDGIQAATGASNEEMQQMRRDVRDLFIRHEYNQDIPRDQRVPIELPPDAVPKPERRN
jgi:hypothetical protein